MRLNFGKYAGKPLEEIPINYLTWVLENCDNLTLSLRRTIEETVEGHRQAQQQKRGTRRQPSRPDAAPGAMVDMQGVIRTWYRELVLRYHPDRGGDGRTMQALNDAHDRLKELAGIR